MEHIIYVQPVVHKKEKRLKLIINFDLSLAERLNAIEGIRWSQTLQCWHIPYVPDYKDLIATYVGSVNVMEYYDYLIQVLNASVHIDRYYYAFKVKVDFERDIMEISTPSQYPKTLAEAFHNLGGKWNATVKRWFLEGVNPHAKELINIIESHLYMPVFIRIRSLHRAEILSSALLSENDVPNNPNAKLILQFENALKFENYSEKTIYIYKSVIRVFMSFFKNRDFEQLSDNEIKGYVFSQLDKLGSRSQQNQTTTTIRHFYKCCYRRVIDLTDLPRPRTAHPLPHVLSKEDVQKLLLAIHNLKHRTILCLIYSAGLRISEAVNMRVKDIDSNRMVIYVYQAKGRKDRVVTLSVKILEMLRDYYKKYKPIEYLFEGASGVSYSSRSIQAIFRAAKEKAGITKPASVHTLRHSYATHLHEAGTDIRFIQELLGHSSAKTTQIYTHISKRSIENIQSPFDDLTVIKPELNKE